jgi:hypothetical protein
VAVVCSPRLQGLLVLEPLLQPEEEAGPAAGRERRRGGPPPGAVVGYRLHALAQRTAQELVEVRPLAALRCSAWPGLAWHAVRGSCVETVASS